jgi:hypothetical protein
MALVLTLTKEQTKLFWGEDGGGDYSLLGERGDSSLLGMKRGAEA